MQTKKWKNVLRRNEAFHHLFESQTCSSLSKCYFCIVLNNPLSHYEAWQELIAVVLPSSSPAWKEKALLGVSFGEYHFPKQQSQILSSHCLRDILFQNKAIQAYLCSTALQQKTERDSWSYTSVPLLEAVGCLTAPRAGCSLRHLLGRELESTGSSSIKKTSLSISP